MRCCPLHSTYPPKCASLVLKIYHSIFHFPTQHHNLYLRLLSAVTTFTTQSLFLLLIIFYFIFRFALSYCICLPPPMPAINFMLFHLSFMYLYSECHIYFLIFILLYFYFRYNRMVSHFSVISCTFQRDPSTVASSRSSTSLFHHFISYLPFAIFILSFYLCISYSTPELHNFVLTPLL